MKVTLKEKEPKKYIVYIPYVHKFKVLAINEKQAVRKAEDKGWGEGKVMSRLDNQITVEEE
jgi:hypothetical protein